MRQNIGRPLTSEDANFRDQTAAVLDVPPDLVQPFVSKATFADALPVFARCTAMRLDDTLTGTIMQFTNEHDVLGPVVKACL